MANLSQSFVSTLVTDIIDARALLSSADTPVNRRHVVRATLAGVEGLAWYCREHIREIAGQMGHLTPLADMALREQSYVVTEHGEILEQVRYLSLTSSIRLMVKQASQLEPSFDVDFSVAGWHRLRQAIAVRHRITHPKKIDDLYVSHSDVIVMGEGFQWFLTVCLELLTSTTASYGAFVRLSRDFLDRLKAGELQTLTKYRAALLSNED